jgi:hypothetical protein
VANTSPLTCGKGLEEARPFLFALRCYLHYFSGRDSNRLPFDLQDTIAHDGSGKAFARFPARRIGCANTIATCARSALGPARDG